jgi:hypothetical protein
MIPTFKVNPSATMINSIDQFTVTYPPAVLSYIQSINDVESLVQVAHLSSSYAGLLYFPTALNCSDNGTGVPANGITLDKLPYGFNLIAMIPISICTSSYLSQAKKDEAEGAILYNFTFNSNALDSLIQSSFNNPVWGITKEDASPLLQNMINYASNMSTVPYGHNLSALYDPTDYVRLTMTIDNTSSQPLLIAIICGTLVALGVIFIIIFKLRLYKQKRREGRIRGAELPNARVQIDTIMKGEGQHTELGGRLNPESASDQDIGGRLQHSYIDIPDGGHVQYDV